MTTAKPTKFNVYHLHYRLHLLWTLSIACFILSKLWWLVPLPGYNILPAYRTYPASFFDTFFLTFACAFATRSIVIGLFKTLRDGIHPDSIVAFGSTGGYTAMWSCIKNKSGIRYFLVAMLVTACTLLGSALQGELQSSLSIYYKLGGETSLNTAECSHATQTDYLLASSAFASGLISNTVSDATSLLDTLNASQPMRSFMISTIKTTLAPIQNVTFLPPPPSGTNILRRHYRHHHNSTKATIATTKTKSKTVKTTTATTNQLESSATLHVQSTTTTTTNVGIVPLLVPLSTPTTKVVDNTETMGNDPVTTENSENSTSNETNNSINEISNTIVDTASGSDTLLIPLSAISGVSNQSSSNTLAIIRNSTDFTQTGQSAIITEELQLNIIRYRTPDNYETVIMYTPEGNQYNAGVYVSAISTNYTCQSRGGDTMICDEGVYYTADSTVVANALVAAIQSGDGLYGTQEGGLVMDIVNNVDSNGKNSKLVDALFANPLCRNPDLIPTSGNVLLPYTAARMTPLVILWLLLYVVLWMIGVYLIGYTEHTWTKLAVSGSLVPQIISKSPNMFESDQVGALPINQEMYLDPETGRMGVERVYRHGYSISTTELEA
ncbi:hypothetical protein BD770DRAFT_396595 [Pilaira anomala]|nr:hypothetical protein BD770DRAFT_396595 [Pilaira anomala]